MPAKKRVFIEGDVRIDFYAKKWFKGLGWTLVSYILLSIDIQNKAIFLVHFICLFCKYNKLNDYSCIMQKDREKLGHVWFNTMFTCPGYCGGTYIHGDEAYPYPKGGSKQFSSRFLHSLFKLSGTS